MSRNIRTAVQSATDLLKKAGVEDARRDAALLLASILAKDSGFLHREPDYLLSEDEDDAFDTAVGRRVKREPVSHILGRREFWSLEFAVGPEVLDPRPDSETLIAAALAACEENVNPRKILDLGTGSGCLLLSLLSELPKAQGLGIDASEAALRVAAENAAMLQLDTRARFRTGNWCAGLQESFDLVISNPPYIADKDVDTLAPEVREYEPRLALAGGADGLDCYRIILSELFAVLEPGGLAVFELGIGQAERVSHLMTAAGLQNIARHRDLAGIERCLSGWRGI
ncbi:MAG: peptide chain release factor N(5)-glutamine methyltransferase [Alphaproteobacteria bacterium]|nr:MAG: peptide chain release factor N(5)-glutamine methyltransferase [Alphaproteobacteria bacterium]